MDEKRCDRCRLWEMSGVSAELGTCISENLYSKRIATREDFFCKFFQDKRRFIYYGRQLQNTYTERTFCMHGVDLRMVEALCAFINDI